MKRIHILMFFALAALLAIVVYLTRSGTPNERQENRTEETAIDPSSLHATQNAFPQAYQPGKSDDPCEWRYYFFGKAILIDTLFLQAGHTIVTRPSGHKVTGYVIDYDTWDPEQTIKIRYPITLEEAKQLAAPPYGEVERWTDGPYLHLVRQGCDNPKGQPVSPIR